MAVSKPYGPPSLSVNRQNPQFRPVTVRSPVERVEWERAYLLRWRVLRKPWGQPRDSERDPLDTIAVHRAAFADNGEVVGVGRLHLNSPTEGQIRYMAVDEQWQGQGIGTAILCALEAEAVRLGVRRVVLDARSGAIPFYLRHGYRVVAPGKRLFGSIAHSVMVKDFE
jgi:GNAT superfamily N-acetyltransferase